jgi:hypothetical protein
LRVEVQQVSQMAACAHRQPLSNPIHRHGGFSPQPCGERHLERMALAPTGQLPGPHTLGWECLPDEPLSLGVRRLGQFQPVTAAVHGLAGRSSSSLLRTLSHVPGAPPIGSPSALYRYAPQARAEGECHAAQGAFKNRSRRRVVGAFVPDGTQISADCTSAATIPWLLKRCQSKRCQSMIMSYSEAREVGTVCIIID